MQRYRYNSLNHILHRCVNGLCFDGFEFKFIVFEVDIIMFKIHPSPRQSGYAIQQCDLFSRPSCTILILATNYESDAFGKILSLH